ncbi:MAG: hypothetical protein QNJ41_05655 [Xenococcaceae cyanobacterium MO_188.B32]|nr:hypothetical protein [Xenococcaceae cyanobacterium MO_188.B32]
MPYALEAKYGKYIHAPLTFEYSQGQEWILDAIKNNRALSYRIYAKNLRWFIACSLDVPDPDEFLALAKKGSCSQKKRRRRSSKGG